MAEHDGWVWQGRQDHGWFGTGTKPGGESGDGVDELFGPGGLDRRIFAVAYGALGHLPRPERGMYERQLQQGGLERLREAMPVWVRGAGMTPETFRERFFGPFTHAGAAEGVRRAARGADLARTHAALAEAGGHLAGAVRAVGVGMWPSFLAEGAQRAVAVSGAGSGRPGVERVQELLLTPRPFLFTEPPKEIIPRLMERIPRQSGKEAADDVPSWARGQPRRVGETPRRYAKRVMDKQYGPGNWKEGGREYNQIKKFGQRGFRYPQADTLIEGNHPPEA